MILALVKNMISSYVNRTIILLVCIGFLWIPFDSVLAQTPTVFTTPLGTSQVNQVRCDEAQPLRLNVNTHPDLYGINEVRLPFSILNAGANRGTWSDFKLYIDNVLVEDQPGNIAITWLYHNGSNSINPDTELWTKIPLSGAYDIASTTQIDVEVTCTGFYLFKDISTASPRTTNDYVQPDGGSPDYTTGAIVALAGTTAPPPPPDPAAPLGFSLFAESTPPSTLSASVIDGVQETGESIWPLMVFVGVGLAFVIALQTVVFTKRAIGGPGGDPGGATSAKNAPYRDSRGRFAKLPRQSDYKAYKRGKRANKEDGLTLINKND